MSRVFAITLALLAGCTLFHGDNSDRVVNDKGSGNVDGGFGIDGCNTTGTEIQLLNPSTLACEGFSIGSPCNPSTCDSCPQVVDAGSLPNWAQCSSSCLGLSEQVCGTTPECRVTKEANHYFGFVTGDPFLGCFPRNNDVPDINGVCSLLDAYACSSVPSCWAVYDAPAGVQCGIAHAQGGTAHAEGCPSGNFVACVHAGASLPGRCDGTITCSTPTPSCPAGTVPGIDNGCYTGVCIPQQYCVVPG